VQGITFRWRILVSRRKAGETLYSPAQTGLFRQLFLPGSVFSFFACETVEPHLNNSE
jgi:hypothetical protein